MDKQKIAKRNIRLYKWSMSLMDPFFWGPILIFYIQHVGHMTLSEIYFMESVVVFGLVILEVPSGAFADIVGRKRSILFGSIFLTLSAIGFAMATSPAWIWGMNIMWMLGLSLRSGADSAFLYDSLKDIGRESEYQKIQGGVIGNKIFLMGIASLFSGVLADIHIRLPAILSVPSVLIATLITFFFVEPTQATTQKIKGIKKRAIHFWEFIKEQFSVMKFSVLFVANHKAVKWIIFFGALIGVSSKVWFFTYNPYFELVDLDLKLYGVVFFFLNMTAWITSKYAYRIEQKLSEQTLLILVVLFIAVPVFIMGSIVTKFMVSLVFFQNVVRGFMEPFLGGFMNRHLDSKNRATVLSIKSAVVGFFQTISLGVFGFMLGILPLDTNLQILGLVTLIGGYISLRAYKKIFS